MTTQAADCFDVITQLPPGSKLVLYDITSVAFPFLDAQRVGEFISSSARSGPRQARQELRNWLKSTG